MTEWRRGTEKPHRVPIAALISVGWDDVPYLLDGIFEWTQRDPCWHLENGEDCDRDLSPEEFKWIPEDELFPKRAIKND